MHGTMVNAGENVDNQYYRPMFQEHSAVKLLIDPVTGAIQDANPAACAFYGYSHEQLTALNISDLNVLPPEEIARELERAASRPANTFIFPHRLANGDIRTVEAHASPINIQGKRLLYSIITDATQRQRTEDILHQRTEQLRLLHEAAQHLSESLDLDAIYNTLHGVIAGVMDCDSLVVSQYSPADNLIRCVHLRHEGQILDADSLPPLPLNQEGRGTQSISIRTGQSLLLNDYRDYVRTSNHRYLFDNDRVMKLDDMPPDEQAEKDIPYAALIVPLKLENAVTGVIQVFSLRRNAYTHADLWLLESLAAHVAIAAKNAALYRQAQAELAERRRAEADARASEEKFRAIFNEVPDVILIVGEDARILSVNRAVRGLLGYSVDELIGQPFWRLLPQGAAIVGDDWVASVTAIRQSVRAFDFLKADGTTCPMEWSAVLIPWDNRRAVLATLRDITEHRLLEEERLKAELLYLQIQKERELVALREQFINTISHEFRTPLAVIQSSSDLLEHYRERLSVGHQIDHLREIKRQVRRMADMIEDVLKISKARAGKLKFRPALLNVNDFCRSLLSQVQRTASDKHRLVFTADADHQAYMDERLLTHILINLLTNAVKYSPEGGEVQLKLWADGDDLVFEVNDPGIGIPLEDQRQLFEPFHRAANVGDIEGSGLGLVVVKDSVMLHGGTLQFHSQPGHGTTFSVRLPRGRAATR